MAKHSSERLTEIIVRCAALFIKEESSLESLITITRAELSRDGKTLTFFINVIPENKEYPALVFLRRKRHPLFQYLQKHTGLSFIPKIVFEINEGEKHRRRIDEIIDAENRG